MSETFKPGQTVWQRCTLRHRKVIFRASSEAMAWCEVHPDEPACNDRYENVPLDSLTATDPNAEPEPQKCQNCGNLQIEIFEDVFYAECTYCKMSGPVKPTRLEAIQAWNSICVRRADILDKAECGAIEALAVQPKE